MSENNTIIEEDDRNIIQKLDCKYNNILAAKLGRFPRIGQAVVVTTVAATAVTAAVVMLKSNSKKNRSNSED